MPFPTRLRLNAALPCRTGALGALPALLLSFLCLIPASRAQPTPASPAILSAAEAAKIMPPSVFFKGLTAPIQARNAAGVRFSPEAVLLTALVDTSGYSTQVQARYQAYLITEAPLTIDTHRLAPGAYGVGFIADDTFLVMDIAGNQLFTAHSTRDPGLRRPTPLQILPDPASRTSFRLYVGRSFIAFAAAAGSQ